MHESRAICELSYKYVNERTPFFLIIVFATVFDQAFCTLLNNLHMLLRLQCNVNIIRK